jgi:hypothetical protein
MTQLIDNESNRSLKQELDSTYIDHWDNNDWSGNFIFSYSYDSNGNMLERTNMSWFHFGSRWEPSTKYKYSYDQYGNNIDYMILNWDTALNDWREGNKTANIYNANNQMLQYIEYSKGISSNIWYKSSKVNYSYNMNGSLENVLRYNWNSTMNFWDASEKTENILNINDQVEVSTEYSWDQSLNQWKVIQKTENSYDGNQNIVESETFVWNNSSNSWGSDMVTAYIYNNDELLIESSVLSTSNWYRSRKIAYIYDLNNNAVQENYYLRDTINNDWENEFQKLYNYNNAYERSDLILPYNSKNSRFMNHMMTEVVGYLWNKSSNTWKKYDKASNVFSERNINSIENIQKLELRTFPNPVKDVLYFDINDNLRSALVNIYDVQGSLVKSEWLSNSRVLNLNGFTSGVYFYSVAVGGEFYNGKLIKE